MPVHKVNIFFLLISAVFEGFPPPVFASDGELPLLWRQALGGTAIVQAETSQDFITVITDDGTLTALGGNGDVLWKYKSRGRLLPLYTRSARGVSYICRPDGLLSAVSRNGVLLWQYKPEGVLCAAPLTGFDGRLFLFAGSKVICLNERGVRLWEETLSAPPARTPLPDYRGGFLVILKDNTLARGGPFGTLSAVRLEGSPFAALPLEQADSGNRESAGKNQNQNPGDAGSFLVIDADGTLTLFENGAPAAGEKLEAPPLAAACAGDFAAFQLNNRKLILWSLKSRKILWAASSSPGVGAPEVGIADGGAHKIRIEIQLKTESGKRQPSRLNSVSVLSVSGAVSFSAGGSELWSLRLEKTSVTPSLDFPVLYACGNDWILYACKVNGYGGLYPGKDAAAKADFSFPAPDNYGLRTAANSKEAKDLYLFYKNDFYFLIKSITGALKEGNIGERERRWTGYLLKIAADKDFLMNHRLAALNLLGVFASPEAAASVLAILKQENEPSLAAEAVLTLGKLGDGLGGAVLFAFNRLIASSRNESLLVSVAEATGELSRYGDPEVYRESINLLMKLSENDMPAVVRSRARLALEKMSGP